MKKRRGRREEENRQGSREQKRKDEIEPEKLHFVLYVALDISEVKFQRIVVPLLVMGKH